MSNIIMYLRIELDLVLLLIDFSQMMALVTSGSQTVLVDGQFMQRFLFGLQLCRKLGLSTQLPKDWG